MYKGELILNLYIAPLEALAKSYQDEPNHVSLAQDSLSEAELQSSDDPSSSE